MTTFEPSPSPRGGNDRTASSGAPTSRSHRIAAAESTWWCEAACVVITVTTSLSTQRSSLARVSAPNIVLVITMKGSACRGEVDENSIIERSTLLRWRLWFGRRGSFEQQNWTTGTLCRLVASIAYKSPTPIDQPAGRLTNWLTAMSVVLYGRDASMLAADVRRRDAFCMTSSCRVGNTRRHRVDFVIVRWNAWIRHELRRCLSLSLSLCVFHVQLVPNTFYCVTEAMFIIRHTLNCRV